MSDIFLSYAHHDFDRIKVLAAALQSQGWTVFYDRTIPPGKTWRQVISKEIDECRCMIVVWSKHSVASHWVEIEADKGLQRKILVPLLLDQVTPPLGFESIQAANLVGWSGKMDSFSYLALCNALTERLGSQCIGNVPKKYSSNQDILKTLKISVAIILVIILILGMSWYIIPILLSKNDDSIPFYIALNNGYDKLLTEQANQIDNEAEFNTNPKLLNTKEIAEIYSDSTVYIESSWELIDEGSGKQLFHKVGCTERDKKGYCKNAVLPLYFNYEGVQEPWLVTEEESIDGKNIPIGVLGNGQYGSGFIVTKNGFILSSRHIVTGWNADYSESLNFPGYLFTYDRNKLILEKNKIDNLNNSWIPAKSRIISIMGESLRSSKISGRNVFLDVWLPDSHLGLPARVVRISDSADVALIKIDIPSEVTPVILGENDEERSGNEITIIGYLLTSPDLAFKAKIDDSIHRSSNKKTFQLPTASSGIITKIIGIDADKESNSVYQLTVNSTSSGFSGGPVFNSVGHVIGLYIYGGEGKSFAVPIRYGEELMGIKTTK